MGCRRRGGSGPPGQVPGLLQARLDRPDPALSGGEAGGDDRGIRAFRHAYSGRHGNPYPPFPTANGILKMARFSDVKWARSDLNRRPPGYQPGAPAKLSYGPHRQEICRHLSLSGPISHAGGSDHHSHIPTPSPGPFGITSLPSWTVTPRQGSSARRRFPSRSA